MRLFSQRKNFYRKKIAARIFILIYLLVYLHTEQIIKLKNMINIEGIQVDVVGNPDTLSTEWAIFTVEFEYDSRIMVCHTFNWTVRKEIVRLIHKILSPKVEGLDLRQSFVNSQYITIEVKSHFTGNCSAVLENKYQLIKDNVTYYPYGYNFLLLVNSRIEKPYAFAIYNKLIDDISTDALKRVGLIKTKEPKGRMPKPVYQYSKETGLFVAEYNSVKEAAIELNISATSINMCCNGHIKSAAGFLWSYEKVGIIEDIPSDKRKKLKEMPNITEIIDSIKKKQQNFIAANKK